MVFFFVFTVLLLEFNLLSADGALVETDPNMKSVIQIISYANEVQEMRDFILNNHVYRITSKIKIILRNILFCFVV